MTTVEVFAPAKINLTLHVTGQRADGYHLLDTLVAFAGVGDRLTLRSGGSGHIAVTGPEGAHLPAGRDNLIARQAQHLPLADRIDCTLLKDLPVASGMGGGSADAAAYYRGVARLAGADRAEKMMRRGAIAAQWRVGADVPMCIESQPARATGIGEKVQVLPDLPALPVVLVNPRAEVPTAMVFTNLSSRENAPMPSLPDFNGPQDVVVAWLAAQRNDLQAPAIAQVPVISEVLALLQDQPGCGLARMSGSGATCFGLFSTDARAGDAAAILQQERPRWWVRATRLDGQHRSAAQVMRSTT